ncbi:MAG: hypothetical protein AVDCRST_MAG69-2634 [uncultured Solirubrobacteraceae bacterium]|uniref:Sulphur transport domain-containing protein n=1 Tax=uncultured Solirubrobacteraceae bacterium TaxID=1162706 RepID=A0A6J4T4F2_9ACTN|nr:MAG: hypothetical protein AVDCRST_MAG69-2634 [uncultured Solirubrobacteraceae bacterium]
MTRAPWYVVGVALGLVVVASLVTINQRIGAVGGYSDVVDRLSGRSASFGWRAWFLLGIVGGSGLFVLLGGSTGARPGYGWLTRALGGDLEVLAVPILFAAGLLIGYGAKLAGGCTSGNGLCGSSLGSPASLAATATFMATAVITTLALSVVI